MKLLQDSQPLQFAGWAPPHKPHVAGESRLFLHAVVLCGPPHFTQRNDLLQYVLVWPYCWHLVHWVIPFLGVSIFISLLLRLLILQQQRELKARIFWCRSVSLSVCTSVHQSISSKSFLLTRYLHIDMSQNLEIRNAFHFQADLGTRIFCLDPPVCLLRPSQNKLSISRYHQSGQIQRFEIQYIDYSFAKIITREDWKSGRLFVHHRTIYCVRYKLLNFCMSVTNELPNTRNFRYKQVHPFSNLIDSEEI